MIEVFKLADIAKNFTAIFWGHSGTGKTVMAATGRRPILYLSWDINGFASVEDGADFHIMNFAQAPNEIVEQFLQPDSKTFNEMAEYVKEHKIKTVISDSITSFAARALTHAGKIGSAYAKGKEQVSIYKPGFTGYGIRTTLLHQYVYNVGMFCDKHTLDCIFIGHEDQPKTVGEGENQRMLYTTMRLGGDNGFEVPKDVREVWHFKVDTGGETYTISLRPFPVEVGKSALMRPMKSTMFDTTLLKSITWEKGEDALSTWIEKWLTKGSQLTAKDLA